MSDFERVSLSRPTAIVIVLQAAVLAVVICLVQVDRTGATDPDGHESATSTIERAATE
jgi:hypothetical protein